MGAPASAAAGRLMVPAAITAVLPGQTATTQAVEITHLRKTYGPVVAVDDVSFSVRRARCC